MQQQGGRLPARDLGPLLHMYKARLAVACNNHKAAKKEVGWLRLAGPWVFLGHTQASTQLMCVGLYRRCTVQALSLRVLP